MPIEMPKGTHLAYYVADEEARWAQRSTPERPYIMVSASAGAGVAWEFKVAEHELSTLFSSVRVQIFSDAWAAFVDAAPLFQALAASGASTLAEVRALLDSLGAVDETERAVVGIED